MKKVCQKKHNEKSMSKKNTMKKVCQKTMKNVYQKNNDIGMSKKQ
jgi:hypothetical protein